MVSNHGNKTLATTGEKQPVQDNLSSLPVLLQPQLPLSNATTKVNSLPWQRFLQQQGQFPHHVSTSNEHQGSVGLWLEMNLCREITWDCPCGGFQYSKIKEVDRVYDFLAGLNSKFDVV
ncbi:Copia protein [Cucumis melo var. makuwa]|uniref:Copia protein n=1 Tax=Cucumis melo var. makuwa TaxID=1194695 RepID=A0A5D3DTN2_CUCMM|nr:Copia protein [Cucumis melo var. makuwa]TYK26864.1 Copia protein [Cucumis melo var. makuwa]